MKSSNARVAIAIACGLGFAPVAPAQTTSASGDVLEEVIVTAEKRETTVQKTAISMVVLSGEEAANKGTTSLNDVLRTVPSLKLEGHAQGAQVFIRGVGSNMDPTIGDSAVAVSVDGGYSNRSEAVLSTMNDVERVEVLRGPQGTLYGRNATGGQVNVVSADPKLDKFESSARVGAGNYSLLSASGMLNLPLSDALGFRASFIRETHDGYLSDGNLDNNTWSFRLKALVQPNESFRFVPKLEYYQFDGSNIATVFDPKVRPAPNYNSDPWWDPYAKSNSGIQNFNVNLKTEITTGIGKLTLTPTYSHQRRCNGVYLITAPGKPAPPGVGAPPFVSADPVNQVISGQAVVTCGGALGGFSNAVPVGLNQQDEYTLEARLNSPESSNIKWTVGVFGYKLDATNVPVGGPNLVVPSGFGCGTLTAANINCVVYQEGARPTKSYAVFGQLTYPLTDVFRLVAGVRYNNDNRQTDYYLVDYSQSISAPVITNHVGGDAQRPVTWKAGAEYDLSSASMLYATVSTGFKSGGQSQNVIRDAGGNLTSDTYEPEKLTAFEIGSKNRFLDDRLQLNASVYLYRYNQFQIQYGGAASATGGFCNCVKNADTGTMKGAEAELQWLVTKNDRLDLTASAEDAKYGKLIIDNLNVPLIPFTSIDLTGHDMANAPKWTAALGYQHSWPLADGKLTVRGDARASAGYWSTVEVYFADVYQDAYQTYDANVSYEATSGNWGVNLWGKNLGNDYQVTYTMPFGRQMISNPRTYGVTASVRF